MTNATPGKSRMLRFRLRLLLALGIGSVCFLIHLRLPAEDGIRDFFWALQAARDLLTGGDPYAYPLDWQMVSYPLPAAFIGLLFAWLPTTYAAALFMGSSAGLLTWAQLRNGELWRLLLFVSWPFVYSVLFTQWTPLLLVMATYPAFLPLILVKPQIALPVALTRKPSLPGIGLTVALGLLSLAIYPTWPFVWIEQSVGRYQGLTPPMLASPLSALLLLALLRWREPRAWLLLLAACMPQRMVYDQLLLLLIPENRREMLFLISISWGSCFLLFAGYSWSTMPGGWQLWVLLLHYLPALLVVLRLPIPGRRNVDAAPATSNRK